MATLANRALRALLVVLTVIGFSLMAAPITSASAAVGGCHGARCTGLDPTNRCDGDAVTVASISVDNWFASPGQLDLRYSRSCEANWGRFTPYTRYVNSMALGAPVPLWGRVTVWNPGDSSQPTVQSRHSKPLFGSDWSMMVDGTKTACTGVEVFWISDYRGYGPGTVEATEWVWGPCV